MSVDHIEQLFKSYDGAAQRWQKVHQAGRLLMLILGALTAAAGALKLSLSEDAILSSMLNVAVVVLPLLAALTAALLKQPKIVKKWTAFRTGAERLKAEMFLFAAKAGYYNSENRERVLDEQAELIRQSVTEMGGSP